MDQFGRQSRSLLAEANAKTGRSTGTPSAKSNAARSATLRDSKGTTVGTKSASLGKLNAAHASVRGLAHASPNSTVGQIAAYKSAMQAGDVEAAATALAGVANKGVTTQTVSELNALVGVTATQAQVAAVAQQARDQQTRDAATRTGAAANSQASARSKGLADAPPASATHASQLGRMNAAHASARGLAQASPNSAVGQMAAYQDAVQSKNFDKAAAVLAGASNKGVTEASVRGVNGLLGLTVEDKDVTAMVTRAQELQRAGD